MDRLTNKRCLQIGLMSAMDHKRAFCRVLRMSALPPKAGMDHHGRDVRFVPQADSPSAANRMLAFPVLIAAASGD
jgi:hypothetical protein